MTGKTLTCCGLALLAWLFLIVIQSTALLDIYYVVGLLAMLLLGLFVGGMAAVAVGIKQRNWKLTGVIAAGLGSVLLTMPIAQAMTSFLKKAGLRKAAPVIEAAGRFRASQGRCPEGWDDLVPGWLDKVPAAAMLGTAPYRLSSYNGDFILSFALPDWQQCSYHSAQGRWVVHE